jgi:AcrR family transcriptional regulator
LNGAVNKFHYTYLYIEIMARKYTQTRRAEAQAETRRRIVEAAVGLHGTLGPAFTPLSLVAERAGVQRHTLYAHFPDERSLYLACSGLVFERAPLPDAAPWANIAVPSERLRAGLRAVYGWYERNAQLTGCVLRDAESHALTKEVVALRMGSAMAAYGEVLGAKLDARQRALLHVALGFFTWRALVSEAGMNSDSAADAMVDAILWMNMRRR